MPCDERVGRGIVTYPCTLEPSHKGPHFSPDSPSSAGDRRRWQQEAAAAAEAAQPTLAQFQGPAQTTAERYTENPTPVPLSPGRRRLHAECSDNPATGCLVNEHSECPVASFDHARAHLHPANTSPPPASVDPANKPEDWDDRVQAMRAAVAVAIQPTKQRAGDQVLPTVNDHPDIQSGVIADLEARREVGISRYGTALQPFNGRNTLLDAYEEAMDLTVYLKGLLVMKEALRPQLVEAVQQAFLAESQKEYDPSAQRRDLAEVAVDRILDAALLFEPGPVGP